MAEDGVVSLAADVELLLATVQRMETAAKTIRESAFVQENDQGGIRAY